MVGWTRLLFLVVIATSGGLFLGSNAQFGVTEIGEIVTAIKLVQEILKEVFNVWQILKEVDMPLESVAGGSQFKSKEQQLLARFREVSVALEDLGGHVGAVATSLTNLKEILPEVIRLELRFDTFFNAVTRVHRLGATMARYESRTDQLERYTLEDFAHTIVSHNTGSVYSLMSQIHSLAVGSSSVSEPGILVGLAQAYESGDRSTCGLKQSPHQLVYSLYNLVALTQLKGYAMIQFSWMLLRLYDKGNFTQEAALLKEVTECNAREQAAAATTALRMAPTEFWVCDPPRHLHQENKTFVQLTELLQAQLENEVDLNGDGTCKESCNYYQYTRTHGCYQNLFCNRQRRCKGRLFNCNFIDADAEVCLSDKTHRRYDWVNYENGRVLGKKDTCSRGVSKVDSWWRWLFWHCSYCLCVCDEPGPTSDRFFNLRPVEADVANNRVITGIRIVKMNRVIHMQIQEGEALPRGSINTSSLSWKSVDSYDPEDPRVIQGKDYHMMTYEQRTIDLDDLHAPPGHVCTGVKWRRLGSSVNLEVMVTQMNFTTGKLKPEASTWIGNDNTNAAVEGPRTKINIPYPDVPTRSPVPSVPDSKSDMYLEFSHSSANSDVAQTTVPFMDAQDVTPKPPTWLTGLGIYHKGHTGYGGFIAIKVFTFPYDSYLNATAISSEPLNCI